MSTFKERLEQEAVELNENIVKLQDFTNSEKLNEIDKDHINLNNNNYEIPIYHSNDLPIFLS